MAGFRIGNKTTAILASIGAVLSALFGGVVGRKTAPTTTDARPVINVPPAVTLSEELLPVVVNAIKQKQDADKKKAADQAQTQKDLADAKAKVAALEAKLSPTATGKAN